MSEPFTPHPGFAGPLTRAGRVFLSLLLDLVIVVGSYALALYLKFDGTVPNESWRQLAWAGPLIAFAYILAYQSFGVYRTAWQYGSLRDAFLLAMAVGVVTAGVLFVNALLPHRPIPLTVNVISAAFIFLFHAMARMLPRLWNASGINTVTDVIQQRVLIVGAGEAGQRLAAELLHNRGQPYRPVAFVDDDEGLRGKRVHGIGVAGVLSDLPLVLEKDGIDLVTVALPPEESPRLQEILALCEPFHVPVRIVPALSEIMEGRAQRGEMREITMQDLLARPPLDVSEATSRAAIEGRVVFITGAAGSIGSELSRRVAELNPSALHLLDTNETALHELRLELQQKAAGSYPLKHYLCSITDPRLRDIFEATQPQVVFHLAAYKIVTMVEDHPEEAFENNVLGTLNVFEAAQAVEAEQVIFLSSHTAVNPASVYGASKRVGELLVNSIGSTGSTHFCAIRLTNVIDAKGAVLALFARQIQHGNPITVTDPRVARYFLTIAEVVGVMLQSLTMSNGGEVYVLDVGEETRIGELAERLSRSLEPGKDPQISYIGLRPGEKLRESLIADYERLEPTTHPKVQQVVSTLPFSGTGLRSAIHALALERARPTNLPARLHSLARYDRAPPE